MATAARTSTPITVEEYATQALRSAGLGEEIAPFARKLHAALVAIVECAMDDENRACEKIVEEVGQDVSVQPYDNSLVRTRIAMRRAKWPDPGSRR